MFEGKTLGLNRLPIARLVFLNAPEFMKRQFTHLHENLANSSRLIKYHRGTARNTTAINITSRS